MPRSPTFARIVAVPENRAALLAVKDLASNLASPPPGVIPLYLHGAAGTGKTTLVTALIDDATRHASKPVVHRLAAAEWPSTSSEFADTVASSDLLVIEDAQQLRPQIFESFAGALDERTRLSAATVVTSAAGPQEMGLPARLASRLAAGLVVSLQPLQAASRLAVLLDRAQQRQIAVRREILAFIAEQLSGGGRQLDGAITAVETLSRLHGSSLDIATVSAHFTDQIEASRPTVERITETVGRHFRIDVRRLCSEQRGRNVLLPRQVGMYLARRLTALSLEQIGRYFGGRDHSTVLHACRKVEKALSADPMVSGAVRRLHAELA
jgi:chromosomal replication initiator protein